MIGKLQKLGMTLNLVQSTEGARHYKDSEENRIILYPDGTYNIRGMSDVSMDNGQEAAEKTV